MAVTERKFFDYDNVAYFWLKVKSLVSDKVDKEAGKGLSSNDYTATEKAKLANIEAGAEVNVNADWSASTGDAAILNKPTIPSKTSDLTNDSNFVADSNYTHITVDSSMSGSSTNPVQNSVVKSYIDSAVGSVSGVSFEIVQSLPASGSAGTIYLVSHVVDTYVEADDVTASNFSEKKSTLYEETSTDVYELTSDSSFDENSTYYYKVTTGNQSQNIYDEYIWVSSSSSYEKIGTTDVDLSNYLQDSDVVALTTSEIDAICV